MISYEGLKRLGLTEYEAKAYLSLLKYGPLSGARVARFGGIPPTRVYSALRDLEAKGLVLKVSERPLIFEAEEPDTAINRFVTRKKEEFEIAGKSAVHDLMSLKREEIEPEVKDFVESDIGDKEFWAKANEMIKSSAKEVILLVPGEKLPYETLRVLRYAADSGVKCFVLVTKFMQSSRGYLELIKEQGIHVRVFETFQSLHMVVSDRYRTLFGSPGPKSAKSKAERVSMVFTGSEFSRSQSAYLENLWKRGKQVV